MINIFCPNCSNVAFKNQFQWKGDYWFHSQYSRGLVCTDIPINPHVQNAGYIVYNLVVQKCSLHPHRIFMSPRTQFQFYCKQLQDIMTATLSIKYNNYKYFKSGSKNKNKKKKKSFKIVVWVMVFQCHTFQIMCNSPTLYPRWLPLLVFLTQVLIKHFIK